MLALRMKEAPPVVLSRCSPWAEHDRRAALCADPLALGLVMTLTVTVALAPIPPPGASAR